MKPKFKSVFIIIAGVLVSAGAIIWITASAGETSSRIIVHYLFATVGILIVIYGVYSFIRSK